MEFLTEAFLDNINVVYLLPFAVGILAWFIKYLKNYIEEIKKELKEQFEKQSLKYETNFREIYDRLHNMISKHVSKEDIHKLIDINTNAIKENTARIENLTNKIYEQKNIK